MVFSQDGIFTRAEDATDKYGKAKAREKLELLLGEALMQKHESGLTDKQLTEKIKSIGEEIKDGTNPNISQAIIDGYIFEVDRTVPQILQEKGKAKDSISVLEAKRLVTNMEALQEYIGTKVDYKDGENWQIFYYDQAGDFGPENILYLKKAHTANDTTLTLSTKTEETDSAVQMMRRMNPLWAGSSAHNTVDLDNEKACVWLCDPSVWNPQKNDTYSSYAIGSPSIEMYTKAFNVYKTGNKDATNLVYKLDDTSKKLGYLVGANNDYKRNSLRILYRIWINRIRPRKRIYDRKYKLVVGFAFG